VFVRRGLSDVSLDRPSRCVDALQMSNDRSRIEKLFLLYYIAISH